MSLPTQQEIRLILNQIDKSRAKKMKIIYEYKYLGDRMTDSKYKGMLCRAVRRTDGKCIRGKNSNMLVEFEGNIKQVVLARLLRKIHKSGAKKMKIN